MTNQSKVAGRSAFKVILSAVLVVVLIVTTFTATAFADTIDEYDVTVVDNGQSITITTDETEPIEILSTAGIVLSDQDKLDLTSYVMGEGGTIVITRYNTINIKYDGVITAYGVYATTVGEAIDELGITVAQGDAVNYTLDTPIQNGMVISIDKAFSVTLTVDGTTTSYAVIEGTVADLLSIANVQLGEDDFTEPELTATLSDGASVQVFRVEYAEVTETEAISYSTSQTNDSTMDAGTQTVVTPGVNGSKDVTYSVKYVDGVEDSREAINEVVIEEPVTQVVKVGTKQNPVDTDSSVTPNGVTSKNGLTIGQTISGRYTHYCSCSRCCGKSNGITASGKRVYNGMEDPHYIACNWLPLGSVVSLNGVNYTVVDRGGRGLSTTGRIDIYTPAGHQAALRGGSGSCTLTIVRFGW